MVEQVFLALGGDRAKLLEAGCFFPSAAAQIERLGLRQHLDRPRRGFGEGELTVFVEDQEPFLAHSEPVTFAEATLTQRDLAGRQVDGGEKGWPEIVARAIDVVADAHQGAVAP